MKPIEWMRAVRDHEPKPGAQSARYAVLFMLALRMDKDGSGFASVRTLAADAEAGESTVRRHLSWARRSDYLEQTRRGHRIDADTVVASEWQLKTPTAHPRAVGPNRSASEHLASDPTAQPGRPNRSASEHPRGPLQEAALQSREAALADALQAVLPDRLAGGLNRLTVEQVCAALPAEWTPEALGRAAESSDWPDDPKRSGIVVGWLKHRRQLKPPAPRKTSEPRARERCAACDRPVAADGSCGCEAQAGAA